VKPRLTLFDLDDTLLHGDSDVLWCEFLVDKGVLERADFAARNAQMQAAYRAGTVDAAAFTNFYVGTLAGRSPELWEPLRQAFLREVIVPRIPDAAMALVRKHLAEDELVAITTATNRFLTELTAAHFGVSHLLATEPGMAGGVFSGRAVGTLNMREGKVTRLHDWLRSRGRTLPDFHSTAYSDSINDLSLLAAVDTAVAVDPGAALAAEAQARGWRVISLH
jgi:HAD superfamily hydrolase (TIGR01490 family)